MSYGRKTGFASDNSLFCRWPIVDNNAIKRLKGALENLSFRLVEANPGFYLLYWPSACSTSLQQATVDDFDHLVVSNERSEIPQSQKQRSATFCRRRASQDH